MTMKMKMKAVLVAAMFATAGLAAQTVQAANFPSSQLVLDPSDGSLSGVFGDTFVGQTGNFEDRFTFSVGSGYEGSSSVTSTFTKLTSDLTITGFNLVRYVGSESNVVGMITGINKTAATVPGGLPADDNWSIASQGLIAGDYYVQILGKVNFPALVSYSGVLTVLAVTPVPEPETYGMMLGGLALLGAVARRKAAKKAA